MYTSALYCNWILVLFTKQLQHLCYPTTLTYLKVKLFYLHSIVSANLINMRYYHQVVLR